MIPFRWYHMAKLKISDSHQNFEDPNFDNYVFTCKQHKHINVKGLLKAGKSTRPKKATLILYL